jgi:hypothetical protein
MSEVLELRYSCPSAIIPCELAASNVASMHFVVLKIAATHGTVYDQMYQLVAQIMCGKTCFSPDKICSLHEIHFQRQAGP